MSKGVLIGLLTASVVAMWGTEANAYNRINGVLVKHSGWVAEVTLSGCERDSLLTLEGKTEVEFICKHGIDPPVLKTQTVDLNIIQQLKNVPLTGVGVVPLTLNLSPAQCPPPFQKVTDSEVLVKFNATTRWKRCTGAELNPCQTTVAIEALGTTNCEPGVRDPAGGVTHQELLCTTMQVGPVGIEVLVPPVCLPLP